MQLTGIKEAMGIQTKAIRDISKNPMFTSIEKRQYIDTLYYGLLQTAQGGLQTMRRFDDAAQQQPAAPVGRFPAMPQPIYRQPSPAALSPGALPINPL